MRIVWSLFLNHNERVRVRCDEIRFERMRERDIRD
jgi:hypothetical protein